MDESLINIRSWICEFHTPHTAVVSCSLCELLTKYHIVSKSNLHNIPQPAIDYIELKLQTQFIVKRSWRRNIVYLNYILYNKFTYKFCFVITITESLEIIGKPPRIKVENPIEVNARESSGPDGEVPTKLIPAY